MSEAPLYDAAKAASSARLPIGPAVIAAGGIPYDGPLLRDVKAGMAEHPEFRGEPVTMWRSDTDPMEFVFVCRGLVMGMSEVPETATLTDAEIRQTVAREIRRQVRAARDEARGVSARPRTRTRAR